MTTKKSRVFITGDIHCPIDIDKLNSKCFDEGNNLTKNDILIICGDAGFVGVQLFLHGGSLALHRFDGHDQRAVALVAAHLAGVLLDVFRSEQHIQLDEIVVHIAGVAHRIGLFHGGDDVVQVIRGGLGPAAAAGQGKRTKGNCHEQRNDLFHLSYSPF